MKHWSFVHLLKLVDFLSCPKILYTFGRSHDQPPPECNSWFCALYFGAKNWWPLPPKFHFVVYILFHCRRAVAELKRAQSEQEFASSPKTFCARLLVSLDNSRIEIQDPQTVSSRMPRVSTWQTEKTVHRTFNTKSWSKALSAS